MGFEGFRTGEDGRAAEALIGQATLVLKGTRGDIPDRFVDILFARAPAEDLLGYEARDLARLAADCFDRLRERRVGTPRIELSSPDGAGTLAGVSVLEIVNDNMPFLVDSVMGELADQGIEVRLVVHPIFTVERDGGGNLIAWLGDQPASARSIRESVMHIHLARIDDAARRDTVVQAIDAALADVRVCVADWRAMLAELAKLIDDLKTTPPPLPAEEIVEAIAFLEWLGADNFTFLGARDYRMTESGELEPDFDTGLGIMRGRDVRVLRRGGELVTMTPEIREFLDRPVPLIVTKANVRSRVHRRVHMDYIGVKRYDDAGKLVGETRLVGLFTSTAYTRSARTIPYIRHKVDAVMARAGFEPASHSGKALVNVLEGYPRDDLFQIDADLLFRHAMAILQLDERPRVRVLTRRDRFDRFVSALLFVPRDRYDSGVRAKIATLLGATFNGRVVQFQPSFGEGPLVRIHFVVARNAAPSPEPDRAGLEDAVARIVRTWGDSLSDALSVVHAPAKAGALAQRWREAFGAAYRDAFSPEQAVADIRVLESLGEQRPVAIDFYRRTGDAAHRSGLKAWSYGEPIALSRRVPILENMGFTVVNERTHRIETVDGARVWLHDMTLEAAGGRDLGAIDQRLEAALMAILRGEAESDGFNALTLVAGVPWRDVALLRALARYLRQIRVPFSQDYLWTTLVRHSGIAAAIVALFHARFDPRLDIAMEERAARQQALLADIEVSLGRVESLDEDRILRHFVNLVQAAVRTSFYQLGKDGKPRPTLSVKFESRKVDGLPLPRPLYEISVYSPRVEGVHLRFGKVARGGLRWSDRPQDFRTEVLGLVKAQQVKNAVIVPVGAKGGFVPKMLPPASDRQAWLAEGTESYKLFVRSLLDVTDNIDGDAIVPPENTIRHDEDDPYLVVAADKGTATFSDTANGLSADKGHWLGDAFASGGSAGYDHKKMGITARGAWEAVKRHFREMDVDIQTTPFTVAGVGDMSGDVFGNGMLLAKTVRLLAAFDHRDIFLDPDPDPAKSWAERKRMFDLPRSSWADYDKSLVSKGGGVFPRSAKAIALSKEAQTMLGVAKAEATPQEVMNAILRMPVDLMWFGGIGTYVRASTETNDQAGDRANDAIRVAGADLACKVVGEGANLGMTQRGRIEAARKGVRLNTDAIDNSAGVNSSDIEVNIKIALSTPMRDGRLVTEARNTLLAEMTDDVAGLVLRNNYLQSLALSLAERRGLEDLGFQQRLMQTLESQGLLDRPVEFLPDDIELAERRAEGRGLTRPELAVLFAYAKLTLYDRLLASPVPDDPYLAMELRRYFPGPVRDRFPDAVDSHRLRREIIATGLANSMINRGGPSFIVRILDQTGADPQATAKAFAAVRDSYGMTALNGAIDALDTKVSGEVQLALYTAVQDLLLSRVVWFLRNVSFDAGLDPVVARFKAGTDALAGALDTLLIGVDGEERARGIAALVQKAVPADLARRIADLPALSVAPDAVLVAEKTGVDVPAATATLFALAQKFDIRRVKDAAAGIPSAERFDRLALDRAVDAMDLALRRVSIDVVSAHGPGPAGVAAWATARGADADRIARALGEIAGSGLTLSKLTVAASLLGDLVRG